MAAAVVVVDLTVPKNTLSETRLESLLEIAKNGTLLDRSSIKDLKGMCTALGCIRSGKNKEELCIRIYKKLQVAEDTTDVFKTKKEAKDKKKQEEEEKKQIQAEADQKAKEEAEKKKQEEEKVLHLISQDVNQAKKTIEEMQKLMNVVKTCQQKEKTALEDIKSKKRSLKEMSNALSACFEDGKTAPAPEELTDKMNKIQTLNDEVASLQTSQEKLRHMVSSLDSCIQPMFPTQAEPTCAICLSEFKGNKTRKALKACGHVFCNECTPKMNLCAVCREPNRGSLVIFL